MEELAVNELDPVTFQLLEYNMTIISIVSIALVVTIIYSFMKGGIKEVIENLLLWFLLGFGFINISLHPVDADDEITAGLLFVAFGVCRIAKNMAKND